MSEEYNFTKCPICNSDQVIQEGTVVYLNAMEKMTIMMCEDCKHKWIKGYE